MWEKLTDRQTDRHSHVVTRIRMPSCNDNAFAISVADASLVNGKKALTEYSSSISRNVFTMVESEKRKLLYAACHLGAGMLNQFFAFFAVTDYIPDSLH